MRVGLVEISDSFGGQYYLPYSIGILQAYAQAHLKNPGDYEFLPIVYKRDEKNYSASSLFHADIIFFSVRMDNLQSNLDIASRFKRYNGNGITVFGGPQIVNKTYPNVDMAVVSSGEIPFLQILEGRCSWDDNEQPDLDTIPSPYLTGVFDPILPLEKWQGRLETNRGCPFTCAFCYWGKKTEPRIRKFDIQRVYQEIDWFAFNKIEFVFCCDANFGILKRDIEIARDVADTKDIFGYPKAFSVQNTKNSTDKIFTLQKILNDAGLQKGVNLALQSTNPATLEAIGRSNISNEVYGELQKKFEAAKIPTFTDILIGLPGETYNSFAEGVSSLIANGQRNRIQFANLMVLPNTTLADPDYQRLHGIKTVETDFVAHHSTIQESIEKQTIVVATNTMPQNDWVKARVFAWMVSLLYFDKLLFLPFNYLHDQYGVPYRELIELFMKKQSGHLMLNNILTGLQDQAYEILSGYSEFVQAPDLLNLNWYPDEVIFMRLVLNGYIEQFYQEAKERLLTINDTVVEFVKENMSRLKLPALGQSDADWCRNVIWYGNKKGDYLND